MMKKVIITGAGGVIGTILQKELSDFVITPLDLPDHDVRDYNLLLKEFPNHDAIIHLAWNTSIENAGSGIIDPENTRMFSNVYRTAQESDVPRVIMASSVHTHKIPSAGTAKPLSPYDQSDPNNPYGAHKIFMETLGKYYSSLGLEVVCIRFGGVAKDNKPITSTDEKLLWLSHRDLGTLVRACVEKDTSKKFVTLWGMSRDAALHYDLSNPFSWIPQDNT